MNTYDRELKGPDSYEYFNSISKKCQSNYINLFRGQLILLLLIAIISICPNDIIFDANYIQGIYIMLMVVVLFLMILQYSKNYMAGWQKARFLAESILSNCWLVVFKCESYSEGTYENSIAKFQDRIKEMKKEINIKDYLSITSPSIVDNDNPKWMRENYSKKIEEKKQYYIKFRISDQISWYSKKATQNANYSMRYFIYGLLSMGFGILLSVLVLVKAIPNIPYLALFTTISASLFSWKQTKRFDELKTTYSVAVDELRDFKNALVRKTSDDDIKEIVFDTEKSISREHKLWFSKVLD
jgi:hypothetical protein